MMRIAGGALSLGILLPVLAWGWNAAGHEMVAEIASHHLTPRAKQLVADYLRSPVPGRRAARITSAAVWLDTLRYRDIRWYDHFHYADISITRDHSALPPLPPVNAIWALEQSRTALKSQRTTMADKSFAMRVMLHVVGDIHQPLHAATEISARLPEGDRGGNLLKLGTNPVANNLHAYWDKGGGMLDIRGKGRRQKIQRIARRLEQQWPCKPGRDAWDPQGWAESSNLIAKTRVYRIDDGDVPSKVYQQDSRVISGQQIALAGCRLAAVLNSL